MNDVIVRADLEVHSKGEIGCTNSFRFFVMKLTHLMLPDELWITCYSFSLYAKNLIVSLGVLAKNSVVVDLELTWQYQLSEFCYKVLLCKPGEGMRNVGLVEPGLPKLVRLHNMQ